MKSASFSSEADRVNRLDREVLEMDRDLEKVRENIVRVGLKLLEDGERFDLLRQDLISELGT